MASSKASTSNPKTSYRVTRTFFLDDVSSKFSNREIIKSEKFFCRHDPHPIIFDFIIEFGTFKKNYFSAFVYSVSHDATLIHSKCSAYNHQGILVNVAKGGRYILEKGKGFGVPNLFSCEEATTGPRASASLRIILEFEYEATSTMVPKLAPSSSSESRLQNDFRQLLISEKDTDVVFLVDGEKIKAHKIILTTRCAYFESMFSSGMMESASKEIVVTDVEPAVFKQLLDFVYTDVAPEWGKSNEAPAPAAATEGGDPLDFLRLRPQFALLRSAFQRNPSVLPAVLRKIGSSNPGLLQLIKQHRQRFIEMLYEPTDGAAPVPNAPGGGLISDSAMKLLAAADKYGVGDLKKYCESTLCSRLNADNVIQALLMADAHDCPDLMATAMSVFGSHIDVLKTQDEWDELKKSPSLLMKLLEHCHE